MSEYRLNINGSMELGDYSSIQDYMKIIGIDDKVTISMNTSNKEAQLICDMLCRDNFSIYSKAESLDGRYYIEVRKKV